MAVKTAKTSGKRGTDYINALPDELLIKVLVQFSLRH